MTEDKAWREIAKQKAALTLHDDIVLLALHAYRVPEVLQDLRLCLKRILAELEVAEVGVARLKAENEKLRSDPPCTGEPKTEGKCTCLSWNGRPCRCDDCKACEKEGPPAPNSGCGCVGCVGEDDNEE